MVFRHFRLGIPIPPCTRKALVLRSPDNPLLFHGRPRTTDLSSRTKNGTIFAKKSFPRACGHGMVNIRFIVSKHQDLIPIRRPGRIRFPDTHPSPGDRKTAGRSGETNHGYSSRPLENILSMAPSGAGLRPPASGSATGSGFRPRRVHGSKADRGYPRGRVQSPGSACASQRPVSGARGAEFPGTRRSGAARFFHGSSTPRDFRERSPSSLRGLFASNLARVYRTSLYKASRPRFPDRGHRVPNRSFFRSPQSLELRPPPRSSVGKPDVAGRIRPRRPSERLRVRGKPLRIRRSPRAGSTQARLREYHGLTGCSKTRSAFTPLA